MTQTQQQTLLPEEVLAGEMEQVQLSALPLAFPGRKVSAGLKESISRFGVLQPVLLIDTGSGLRVADGRNRILNARAAGLDTIPALVFPAAYSPAEVLALVANSQRSDNAVVDLAAVEELMRNGARLEDIAEATGMNKATLDKRLKLLGLIPALRAGLEAGKIAFTTAERAAGLPLAEQKELARLLAENGKLKGKDVAAVRTVVFQGAIAGLPDDLFDTPGLPFDEAPAARQEAQEARELSYKEQVAERGAAVLATLWKLARRWHKQGALSLETDADLWAEVSAFYGDKFKEEDKADGNGEAKPKVQSKRRKSKAKG